MNYRCTGLKELLPIWACWPRWRSNSTHSPPHNRTGKKLCFSHQNIYNCIQLFWVFLSSFTPKHIQNSHFFVRNYSWYNICCNSELLSSKNLVLLKLIIAVLVIIVNIDIFERKRSFLLQFGSRFPLQGEYSEGECCCRSARIQNY